MRFIAISLLALLLAACESNPPAPVIERAPQTKPAPPATKAPSAKPAAGKDWRPDIYTVKKGDTLFSIGLEFGYDYKDIATANNIAPPYPIQIGQKLNFTSLNAKAAPAESKPVPVENDDGVVVSPINTDSAGTTVTPAGTVTKPAQSVVTPVLTEPKAFREPYSLEALNRTPVAIKPTETKPADIKPTDTKPIDTKPSDDENLSWIWPTQGKTIASFNESSNKGIDITGSLGQSINAAASGKVIYTGSDLRGYGKLVIIKHNKIFLSVYAHNSKIIAKEGQTVAAGQKIAEMGNTDTNTVKLHFEIRHQGKSVDPAKYLPQN
jgi:lipoprotein NlpD